MNTNRDNTFKRKVDIGDNIALLSHAPNFV